MSALLRVILIAGVAATSAAVAWLKYRGPEAAASVTSLAPRAPQTSTAPTERSEAPPRTFLGIVLAGESVELAPKLDGRITKIRVKAGDKVARGDFIAQLDVASLRSQFAIAKRVWADARQRLERRMSLTQGALSVEEVANAKVQMWERGERVTQLSQALSDTRIIAPFDGFVTARYVDVGSVVGPMRPVVRIIGASDPRVRFAMPEDQSNGVKVGDRVSVSVKSLGVDLETRVESVSPEVDAASRMFFAEAHLSVPASLRGRLSSSAVARVRPLRATPSGVTR